MSGLPSFNAQQLLEKSQLSQKSICSTRVGVEGCRESVEKAFGNLARRGERDKHVLRKQG